MTDQFQTPQAENFAIGICISDKAVDAIENAPTPITKKITIPAGKPWFVIENRSGGLTVRTRFKVTPIQ